LGYHAGKHVVFGKVVEGLEYLKLIGAFPCHLLHSCESVAMDTALGVEWTEL
jgi:cyclophilin family peptidyl-prolyl cis-trans isomerase